jgi:hypothetical protein
LEFFPIPFDPQELLDLVSKILVNPKIKLGIDFSFFPQIGPAHWPPHP